MSCVLGRDLLCRLSLGVLLTLLIVGCADKGSVTPNKLGLDKYASGNDQPGKYREVLAKPFRAEVLGALERGVLGGKGARKPVSGAKVLFQVDDPDCGAVFDESNGITLETVTDEAGLASAYLRLGAQPGDVSVTASLVDYPDIGKAQFRAIAGLERIGSKLEGGTGGTLDAFGVRLLNPDGSPASGVDVFFRAEGKTDGSSVKKAHVVTDDNGRAVTSWKLGKSVSQYFASVEIEDARKAVGAENHFQVRAIKFEAMAVDKTQMLIVLLGGLAVFIFGMKSMSDGLQRVADRRLKSILSFMTQNRFMAVTAGALMTAIVQSSSATTVMTVRAPGKSFRTSSRTRPSAAM